MKTGAFYVFCIIVFLIGVTSFNTGHDWATAISQAVSVGVFSTFTYIIGCLMGKQRR